MCPLHTAAYVITSNIPQNPEQGGDMSGSEPHKWQVTKLGWRPEPVPITRGSSLYSAHRSTALVLNP